MSLEVWMRPFWKAVAGFVSRVRFDGEGELSPDGLIWRTLTAVLGPYPGEGTRRKLFMNRRGTPCENTRLKTADGLFHLVPGSDAVPKISVVVLP